MIIRRDARLSLAEVLSPEMVNLDFTFESDPLTLSLVLERWPNEYERFLVPSIKAVRREDKKLLLKERFKL